MGAHAMARGAACGVGGATTGQPRWLGGSPFMVPNLETSDVEPKRPPAGRQGCPLHQQLLLRKDRFAGVARFSIAGTTPESCDAVARQATIVELMPDEKTERFLVHSGLAGSTGREHHAKLDGYASLVGT